MHDPSAASRRVGRRGGAQGPPSPNEPLRLRALYAAFATTVLSFAASSIYTHHRLGTIERAAGEIIVNAAPSIEHLTALRVDLRKLARCVRAHVDRSFPTEVTDAAAPRDATLRDATLRDIEDAQRAVQADSYAYVELPVFPGERAVWETVRRDLTHVDDGVQHVLEAVAARDRRAADAVLDGELRAAVTAATSTIAEDIELNARAAGGLAAGIGATHRDAMRVLGALDVLSAALTILVATLTARAIRRRSRFVDAYTNLIEQRADDLEQFAGRVAHDILGPLSTVSLSLEMVARHAEADADLAKRAASIARGKRGVERVQRIVTGLFDFARAGAPPEDHDVRTNAREVLDDLSADLRTRAEEAGAELFIEASAQLEIAVSAGVLTSIVLNLANNAIKYIGDGAVRTITIRALDRAGLARIEVEDTGPGLPPGLEHTVFEPYVRVGNTGKPGIGLGLATVKRMADAHDGACGVRAAVGRGCVFWVELPKARTPAAPAVR